MEGRISDHSQGVGTVTWEMVRQRARELAIINGRSTMEVLDSDFELARRELTGEGDISPQEEAIESLPESERWDPVPGSWGRQAPKIPPDDEPTEQEKLIQEGIEEAEHDQMVRGTEEEARRDRGF